MSDWFWFMYEKKYPLSFISHHDTARLFERGLRRAKIPLEYSKGYNPQPKLSFALPLPVGIEGEREYGEFQLSHVSSDCIFNESKEEMLKRINFYFPRGIKIKDIKKVALAKVPKQMSLVDGSLYLMDFQKVLSTTELKEAVECVSDEDILIVKRKNKKGKIKDVNIKSMIYELTREGSNLRVVLQSGSRGNVRPDELISKILSFVEADSIKEKVNNNIDQKQGLTRSHYQREIHRVKCIRKDVFYLNGKGQEQELRSLWDYLN